ncbi:MAG: phosphoglycolate phosphatase [Oleiphilaceae bacterium]|jgi:phosphoglycolate phosphatase
MFDLDGTLVDSVPDLSFAVDAMLGELGRPIAGLENVSRWVGNGAAMLVKRALSQQMIPVEIEASLYQEAYRLFLDYYQQVNGSKSTLYPAVAETLVEIRNAFPYLALVTNKPAQFTQPLLDYHRLPQFDLIVCGDTLAKRKPHPEPVLHCLNTFGCSVEESVMVGDSVSDIKAAQAANVPVICVSYGYHQGENLSAYRPDRLIQSFEQLLKSY